MKDVTAHVLQVLRTISGTITIDDDELVETDYLDSDLIDSLQIVEMITRLENDFGIRFTHVELESEKFRTLKGVGDIIQAYLIEKKQ